SDAAAQELRPRRNRGLRIRPLGQESPKSGVMPAEVMSATVSVVPNPCAQAFGLAKQLLVRHPLEILVHVTSPLGCEPSHGLVRPTRIGRNQIETVTQRALLHSGGDVVRGVTASGLMMSRT